MLRQLPKDTILFTTIDGLSGVAYSWEYFKNNFITIPKEYTRVYYKVTKSRDSWINYKRTIRHKQGTREQKIKLALADETYHVSHLSIPSVKYTYYDKKKKVLTDTIIPYDGYYKSNFFFHRNDRKLNVESILKLKPADPITNPNFILYYWMGNDLVVDFPDDISNAMISINMLFSKYKQLTKTRIIYKNIKQRIVAYNGMDDDSKVYDIRFNVYRWNKLKKLDEVHPILAGNYMDTFILKKHIKPSFIIWNGINYDYEFISPTEIRIIGLKNSWFKTNELDNIRIIQYESEIEDVACIMYKHDGIPNRYKNSIDFSIPIDDTMILYNGTDHEYAIEDVNAIAYVRSTYALYGDVGTEAKYSNISFMKRNI